MVKKVSTLKKKTLKNSTKVVKMVKQLFFSSNKSRMVKKCQTGSNMVKNYQEKCQQLLKIVNSFQKKTKIVKHVLKWPKIILKNQKLYGKVGKAMRVWRELR